ncbi:LnmK family bifunctional acyltransferase/decarboxylase [Prosthecobacter sp. SYSU 5D2]|uniref:LnmK family bifunctional acyltransferase/decarboxylase n=1 Tax=Prosthecobacter sp. SYSU 5D2 TaxID=3134134 RepID=UPI0031FF390C
MNYEDRLRKLLSSILRLSESRLKPNGHIMDELGADSLQFLDYIRSVEKEFGLTLKGSDSDHFATLKKAAAFLEKQQIGTAAPQEAPAPVENAATVFQAGMWLDDQGLLHYPLEIGMPLTGRNNLGETAILKLIGDLRWRHVNFFSKVPSKLLCDDTGERLYATFFYVEANFSESAPLSSFRENDELHIVSSLKSSGGSVLDGYHWLFHGPMQNPPADPSAQGVPYFRTSNIFVKMLQGAQWLKKSKPCQPGMARIPQMEGAPDSAEMCRQADENNGFGPIPQDWLTLSEGPVEIFYDIVPDRDLNGAGLLYFANYPQILDIVEREVLQKKLPLPFEETTVDRRTVVRRQSAYLSNASQSDRLRIHVTVAAENPFIPLAGRPEKPEERSIHLWLNFVMWRCSDDRKMMVSTVRKVITDMTWGGTRVMKQLQTINPIVPA